MDINNPGSSGRTHVRQDSQPAQHKRKKKNHYRAMSRKLLVLICLCIVGLGAVLILRLHYTHTPSAKKLHSYLSDGAYLSGIVIDGKNVSGMTLDEARSEIAPLVNEAAKNINIRVSHGSDLWVFTAADMKISTNLEYALAEAMLYGRGGTGAANKDAKKELKENGREFDVSFTPDMDVIRARVAEIAAKIDTPATEPSAEANEWADSPGFNYHEGVSGHVLDQDALVQAIVDAITNKDYQAVIKPELVTQEPTHSMDWLKENTQFIAKWQTSFGGSRSARDPGRVGNIQKACTLLNGHKVDVGEEFNFNAFVGPRTESGGWPLAPGIVNGDRYELQPGGGICQVTTTLYNALLCCGQDKVEITERYHHSWPSSYADIGLDSTVTGTVESGKSLNFKNTSGAPMYIFLYCDQAAYTVTAYVYGEPLPEGITYKPRGDVVETTDPPETVTTENPNWPLGYKQKEASARKGYKSNVYLDKYVNGVLDESASVLLYTDRYDAKAEKVIIGTGDPSLPKPTD